MATEKQQDILIVGSGGRESAIAFQYRRGFPNIRLHAAPGNDWMREALGVTCHDFKAGDVKGLLELAQQIKPDLTIVGPEDPLVGGIVDLFRENGLKILGPTQAAALIEGSKVFCTELLQRAGVRIPRSWTFSDPDAAADFVYNETDGNVVVKADGLAAGKGVIVCSNNQEAGDAIETIMVQQAFGAAGDGIVIQEKLVGRECSVMVLVDGNGNIVPLPPSRDCKPAYPGGPNTGGMGAYSPVPDFTQEMWDEAIGKIIVPTLHQMEKEERPFTGVLYAGLMEVNGRLYLIEYNCRFGDPETQAVLALLDSSLHDLLMATVEGRLSEYSNQVSWSDDSAVCVVVASEGYPGKCSTGHVIHHLVLAESHATVLHAGTKLNEHGNWINAGGRVLNCVARHRKSSDARLLASRAAETINFRGCWSRGDIGAQS